MLMRSLMAAVIALGTAGGALAQEVDPGSLSVEAPWSRATAPRITTGVVYLSIHNEGEAVDRLIAAETPVAGRVELHAHETVDGVSRMREVEGGIEAPANGVVTLEPHGLHLMLMELESQLVEGEEFPLTLIFEGAGEIEIVVPVESVGALEPHAHDHSHH